MEKIVQSKTKVSILAEISLSCATFIPITLYLLGIGLPSLILILLAPLSLLLAVILGSIACYRISKDEEHLRGKNWAISGIIIGGLLLLVIILISAPKFWKASQMTKRGMAGAKIDIFSTHLENYYADHKRYPLTTEGLTRLETAGYLSLKNEKKSSRGVPLDPWGNEFHYTSDGKSFTVLSYGADGKPGGTGNAADISKTVTAKEK